MVSEKMVALGTKRSVIRELFEYGKKRSAEIGAENVYDFSLGNPSIPAPEAVKNAITKMLDESDPVLIHGYSSAQGDADTRKAISDYLNKTYDTSFNADNFYMTCGAAASLCITLKALIVPDKNEEVITFAPFFPEYNVFVNNMGGKLTVVPPNTKDFQIDFEKFEALLSEKTKAIIVNSPNNPSGVVFSEETIIKLAEILEKKSAEYGHEIYLISDEPYRELVFDGLKVPYLTKYYKNTIVCYSFSKSLSLPGERIGFILVPDEVSDSRTVYGAVCGAGRALGYVCAPTLFQQVIKECIGMTSDISVYKKNRDLLYKGLTELGYDCVKPDGAFYLFVKALEDDTNKFCERAKAHELLVVAGDDFGCTGYVRIAYCVKTETIENSMKAFKNLAEEYGK